MFGDFCFFENPLLVKRFFTKKNGICLADLADTFLLVLVNTLQPLKLKGLQSDGSFQVKFSWTNFEMMKLKALLGDFVRQFASCWRRIDEVNGNFHHLKLS